jgi:hypothetical protein
MIDLRFALRQLFGPVNPVEALLDPAADTAATTVQMID